MSVRPERALSDQNLVSRISSEHLSEQFQRELGHTGDDDLLQSDEVKLDDIHRASGMDRRNCLKSVWRKLYAIPDKPPCRQRHCSPRWRSADWLQQTGRVAEPR